MVAIRILGVLASVMLFAIALQIATRPNPLFERALWTALPLALAVCFAIRALRRRVLGLPIGRAVTYGLVLTLAVLAMVWIEESRPVLVVY